jgi:predicted CopG family antitoxin
MSSRNIAVQNAVYESLLREKRPGESFTVLFRRLLDQREGLEELHGSWEGRRAPPPRRAKRRAPQGGRARP